MVDSAPAVAIQGEPGSFSELAAFEFFSPDAAIQYCADFAQLFAAVREGRSQYGMAPVDNSLGGSIHPVWDLLARERLPIAGEVQIPVRHCLIAQPTARLDQIRRVLSHSQALAQCQDFLRNLVEIEQVEVYDTAGAVKLIRESGAVEEAAIASARAAAHYQMAMLAEDIQSDRRNFTRFLVLANETQTFNEVNLKTTLVVELGDNARELPEVLEVFTRAGIELLKIESCKRLGQPWVYTFYIEIAGDGVAEPHATALKKLCNTVCVHVIGSYPIQNARTG